MSNTLERKDVENTPFGTIHDVENNNWKITLGNNLICSRTFKTFEEAEQYINGVEEFPWDLVFNATTLFVHYIQEEEKKQESNNNKTE